MIKPLTLLLCAFTAISILSCAQSKIVAPSEKTTTEVRASAESSAAKGSKKPALTILMTGDLQGKLAPHRLKTQDKSATEYERGGIGVFSAQLEILKNSSPGNFIWVDSGNSLSGAWDGLQDQGLRQLEWLNQSGLQATTLGNEDLELAPSVLKTRMENSDFPWIVTNARSTLPKEIEPLTKPSALIGTVGIIGIRLEGSASSIVAEVQPEIAKLYQRGASLVIALVGHVAMPEPGALSQVLKLLGKKNIDLVVGNPERRAATTWIAGIPVIQVGSQNQFFGLAVAKATDAAKHAFAKIENPIPICSQVFKNQGNCMGEQKTPAKGRGPLIPTLFLGKELQPTSTARRLLTELDTETKRAVTSTAVILGTSLQHPENCGSESSMGQFVAAAMRKHSNAEVALLSCGFVRSGLGQGPVTREMLFRSMPLDSPWVSVSLTGSELKSLIEITHSGARGFFPISGAKLRIIAPGFAATARDLNSDSKVDAWEVKRAVGIKVADKELIPNRRYRVALLSYLWDGGDDLGWWKGTLSPESLASKQVQSGSIRTLVDDALTHLQQLAGQSAVQIELQDEMDFIQASVKSLRQRVAKKKSTRRGKSS